LRSNIKSLLKKTFDFIHHNSDVANYIAHPTFFTRNRTLTFPVVVSSILNLFKESVEYNLSTLLPCLNLKPVTGAAFSLARYKISLSFFKDLNKILVDFHQKAPAVLWKGFQLIAGDGSTVSLPASSQVKDHFGVHSTNDDGISNCLAQIFMLYDVCTGLVINGRISKTEDSERTLLKDCLIDFPVTKAIFLLDRGFGHFHVCKRFLNSKRDFCIRISGASSLFGKQAMKEPSNDFLICWKPSRKERKTCLKHGLDIEPITVRVSKIKLKSGEIELLVSSLYDKSIYDLADLKELYRLRWGIEEGFKKLKPKMKLEYFGSRKPEGIFQEFEAHLFMMNIIAIMGDAAQQEVENKCSKRKLKYRYNWQNAYRFIRNKIVSLLWFVDIDILVPQLIELIASSITAIKPDRSFPRSPLRKNKTRLHQAYK
jgi:hypothetical protein